MRFVQGRDAFTGKYFLASVETKNPLREVRHLTHNRLIQIKATYFCREQLRRIFFKISNQQQLRGFLMGGEKKRDLKPLCILARDITQADVKLCVQKQKPVWLEQWAHRFPPEILASKRNSSWSKHDVVAKCKRNGRERFAFKLRNDPRSARLMCSHPLFLLSTHCVLNKLTMLSLENKQVVRVKWCPRQKENHLDISATTCRDY